MREAPSRSRRSWFGMLPVVVLIAGCGSAAVRSAPDLTTTQAAPSASGLEAELIARGRLTYCANLRPGRMGFLDKGGKPAGVNIELAHEIALRMGLEAEIREMPFEDLIGAVADGRCDVSISAQHITRTRLEKIDMLPYLQGIQHVVVRAGNPAGIVGLTDLCGKVLAVQTGSTHVDLVLGLGDHSGAGIDLDCTLAGRPKVDLRQFEDDADAIGALAGTTADAYIGSDSVVFDRPAEFEFATALPPIRNGIGLPKHHPALWTAVDGAFQAMVSDGTYQAILERFGGADVSIAN